MKIKKSVEMPGVEPAIPTPVRTLSHAPLKDNLMASREGMRNEEKGFVHILALVVFLFVAAFLTFYTPQSSFSPALAAEIPRTDKGNCRDNPEAPPSVPKEENFTYKWKADCASSCSDNSGCAKNDADPDRVNPQTSNWCFGFGDGSNRCMKLIAINKSDGKVATTTTGKDPSQGTFGKTGTSGTSAASSNACSESATQYFDAKVAVRYARFLAIMKGLPEYCTQADLGVEPEKRGNSKDGGITNGRLFLCSGAGSKAEALDLVWRIISEDGKDIREFDRANPGSDKANVKEIMAGNVSKAETELKITDTYKW